jgi:hypothetical protein
MGEHEFHKIKGVDQEKVSEKMAIFMLHMAKNADKEDPEGDMTHVLDTFTREEMAYVVCVHAASRVLAVLEANPALEKLVAVLKNAEDSKDGKPEN